MVFVVGRAILLYQYILFFVGSSIRNVRYCAASWIVFLSRSCRGERARAGRRDAPFFGRYIIPPPPPRPSKPGPRRPRTVHPRDHTTPSASEETSNNTNYNNDDETTTTTATAATATKQQHKQQQPQQQQQQRQKTATTTTTSATTATRSAFRFYVPGTQITTVKMVHTWYVLQVCHYRGYDIMRIDIMNGIQSAV